MTYECHITIPRPTDIIQKETFERIGEVFGWKTSQIDGDPLLGKAVFAYYTKHEENYQTMQYEMERLAEFLVKGKTEVIRKKIELIMYDTKTGKGIINA